MQEYLFPVGRLSLDVLEAGAVGKPVSSGLNIKVQEEASPLSSFPGCLYHLILLGST